MMPLDLDLDSLATVLKQLPDGAKPAITIYCDGACSGNPGPGGWGAVILYEGQEWEIFGGEPYTTNNRMELAAALQALTSLPHSCHVAVYTDSQYLRNGMTVWMTRWKKNGWLTADKKPVKNQELWQQLDELMAVHTISWHWVKAHAGNRLNERADTLARHAIVQQSIAVMRKQV